MFGEWSVDDKDIAEVLAYRGGIVGTAACTAILTLSMVTDVPELPAAWMNAACIVGAMSFGTSLALIHMYVTSIKLVIQVRAATLASPSCPWQVTMYQTSIMDSC
jgi:uncharacterized integral membrane protein